MAEKCCSSHRPQLLAFKDIVGVPLVSDYEKEFLIEMVMANNEALSHEVL